MSTTHTAPRRKPTHYVTTPNAHRTLALINGVAAASTILICCVVVLGVLDQGTLDQCLTVQSADTCLYALR